jgi:hypothetical protein
MYDQKLMLVHPVLPADGLCRPNGQEQDRLIGPMRVSGGEHE